MKTIPILFLASLMGLAACSEGPAERTGRNIDEAAEDAAEAIEDACENIGDAVNRNPDC